MTNELEQTLLKKQFSHVTKLPLSRTISTLNEATSHLYTSQYIEMLSAPTKEVYLSTAEQFYEANLQLSIFMGFLKEAKKDEENMVKLYQIFSENIVYEDLSDVIQDAFSGLLLHLNDDLKDASGKYEFKQTQGRIWQVQDCLLQILDFIKTHQKK